MQSALVATVQLTEVSLRPRLGRSVTIDQAAGRLGVSRRTLYYRIRDGRLASVRTMGGSQRVLVASLPALGSSRSAS